jgi:histidinol-phosphate aminotransferase
VTTYFRPAIDAMTGYVPGEQPKSDTPIIKLNTNENPYPPSPAAIAALQTLKAEALRRYPDPYASEFRQATSEALSVPMDWIIVGNGSDDILNIIIRACAELCVVSHLNRDAASRYDRDSLRRQLSLADRRTHCC